MGMESKNRRELVFNLLYKEDELEEIEDYYGTIDAKLTDLKHEIEWLEEFKPLSLDVEFEGMKLEREYSLEELGL